MIPQRINEILLEGKENTTITVSGWVRTKRDAKGFSFIELNDGSCLKNLQVIADSLAAQLPFGYYAHYHRKRCPVRRNAYCITRQGSACGA